MKQEVVDYPVPKNIKSEISNLNIQEVLEKEKAIERAKEKILRSIHSGYTGFSFRGGYDSKAIGQHPDNEVEIYSVPIVRILVSILDDNRIIGSYTRGESKTIVERTKNKEDLDLITLSNHVGLNIIKEKESNTLNYSFVGEILEENYEEDSKSKFLDLISSKGGRDRDFYSMKLEDFIKYSNNIDDLRLPNKNFNNGKTLLDEHELEKFVKMALQTEMRKDLPYRNINDEIKNILEEHVDELEEEIPESEFEYEIDRVEEGLFPPVIDHLLEATRKGENLDHMARFTLGSFLINIGMTDDEIVEMLGITDMPDSTQEFVENQTRYQLEHMRERGSEDSYIAPGYSKIESWGVDWEKDALEESVNHPLQYYQIKLQEDEENKSEEEDDGNND